MTVTINDLPLPDSLDSSDPAAADWLAYADIVNGVCRADSGTDMFDGDPRAWLVHMRDQTHTATRILAARDDEGRLVGIGLLAYDRTTDNDVNVDVAVLPENRDAGIEDALEERLELLAREAGRTNARSYAFVRPEAMPDDEGAILRPASGFGGVPRDAGTTGFFLRHGYELGQVERASAFDLRQPLDGVCDMLARAEEFAGPDYEPVWWQAPTPDHLLDDYARAITRMSTDIPTGELDMDEERWDADRVRSRDARQIESGRVWAVAGVVHRTTGRLVAFNEIASHPDPTRAAENFGTIVLAEHRGHRLGTIVKCLGLLRFHEEVPEAPLVQTFNAEENRFMLDVNEAVGFRTVCWTGEWQKKLVR